MVCVEVESCVSLSKVEDEVAVVSVVVALVI